MVGHIHQKRIWLPRNQCGSICLHLRRHIWNSRTSGASRHWDRRELPLEQRPTRRSHWKTYTPAEARIYHSCVEHAIFIGKVSVHLKIQRLNTPHDQLRCRHGKQMKPVRHSSISHAQSPAKKLARAFSQPGVEATAILVTMITWWHDNGDCGCSRFKF